MSESPAHHPSLGSRPASAVGLTAGEDPTTLSSTLSSTAFRKLSDVGVEGKEYSAASPSSRRRTRFADDAPTQEFVVPSVPVIVTAVTPTSASSPKSSFARPTSAASSSSSSSPKHGDTANSSLLSINSAAPEDIESARKSEDVARIMARLRRRSQVMQDLNRRISVTKPVPARPAVTPEEQHKRLLSLVQPLSGIANIDPILNEFDKVVEVQQPLALGISRRSQSLNQQYAGLDQFWTGSDQHRQQESSEEEEQQQQKQPTGLQKCQSWSLGRNRPDFRKQFDLEAKYLLDRLNGIEPAASSPTAAAGGAHTGFGAPGQYSDVAKELKKIKARKGPETAIERRLRLRSRRYTIPHHAKLHQAVRTSGLTQKELIAQKITLLREHQEEMEQFEVEVEQKRTQRWRNLVLKSHHSFLFENRKDAATSPQLGSPSHRSQLSTIGRERDRRGEQVLQRRQQLEEEHQAKILDTIRRRQVRAECAEVSSTGKYRDRYYHILLWAILIKQAVRFQVFVEAFSSVFLRDLSLIAPRLTPRSTSEQPSKDMEPPTPIHEEASATTTLGSIAVLTSGEGTSDSSEDESSEQDDEEEEDTATVASSEPEIEPPVVKWRNSQVLLTTENQG